ncbi:MAG: hypothetical protein EB163_07140 [Nitrososphaeria archaeon]|nr:hypothetical protein [Nitrososphaeria archaeon]
MNQTSFFVDSMLGTIAKKLRMFGFDCKYDSSIDDDYLMLIAKKENRIIITKDSKLAINAIRHNIATITLQAATEKGQLIEIAKKINYKKFTLEHSRCSICNGVINITSKDQLTQKIPLRIVESMEKFWQCDRCAHIYWIGSHIINMERLIAELNNEL